MGGGWLHAAAAVALLCQRDCNKFALKSEIKIVSITTVAALEVGLQSNVSIIMFHSEGAVAMQSSGWRGQVSGTKFTLS